jgi:gliding motility-associated lipoprotein GldH
MLMKNILLWTACLLCLTACTGRTIHEESRVFPTGSWQVDSLQVFKWNINQTAGQYDLYFQLRSGAKYAYCNLYTHYALLNSKGDTIEQRYVEHHLYDCKTGKPLGKGIGDYYEHEFLLLENYPLSDTGTYAVAIRQYMRKDTLANIVAVGVRVEKSE